MTRQRMLFRDLLVLVACLVLALSVTARAEWRIDAESKTVAKNQTGVTANFTFYWDLKIVQFTLPIVVRHAVGDAFWAGSLPYDTTDMDGNRYTQGVTWHSTIPPWALIIMEVRPGQGCEGSGPYDGISPDHFAISAQGVGTLAAQPSGRVLTTIQFDVNGGAGQFEFDTACFTASLSTIFMIDGVTFQDHGPNGLNDVDFNKGTITIPPGNQSIQVESRSVPTSSIGVQSGIKIANEDALGRITIPLISRTVSGGAFWTNMPASLDTLPWTGRLTSALTYSRTLNKSLVDGVSPDPFLIEAYKDTEPALAPGTMQKMIPFVFDVNGSGGSFEIDTASFAPGVGLEVETAGDPGLILVPQFVKGTIVTTAPDTGNKVEIGTVTVQAGTPDVILTIKINTAERMKSVSIPLTARTVSGGAFWASDFDTLTWGMLPPDALSNARQVVKQLNFDYVSPDAFFIWAMSNLEPCLDAGTHPAFLSLTFTVNKQAGVFEIDTTLLPPFHTLSFGYCDKIGAVAPSFTKGIVIINPCDCSMNGDVNCDLFINPLDVAYLISFVYLQADFPCNPGNCYQNGDLNCDGAINPLDLVYLVNAVYKQLDYICDPCTM